MKAFIKANWKLIAIGILFLVLMSMIFRECNREPKVEYRTMPVVDSSELERWQDSAVMYRNRLDTIRKERFKGEQELEKAKRDTKSWIDKYRSARGQKDTVYALSTCDSLTSENESLYYQISEYQKMNDETIGYYELALKASDSAALKQTLFANQWRDVATKATNDFNALGKDYNKLLRKHKRERTVNRILAAAVVVTGGI